MRHGKIEPILTAPQDMIMCVHESQPTYFVSPLFSSR